MTTVDQETRAELRKRFLETLIELKGEPCEITTYEQTKLKAKFSQWHPNGTEMIVKDLETPAYVNMKTAKLRATDILAIRFNKQCN